MKTKGASKKRIQDSKKKKRKGFPVITSYSIHYTKLYELPAVQMPVPLEYVPCVAELETNQQSHCYYQQTLVITSYSIHYTKLYDWGRQKRPPLFGEVNLMVSM